MIGARAFIAMSWILMIFCAWVSESEPPNTVKSLAKTNTVRPLTVPQPVTTPSPGIFVLLHAEFGRAVLDEHVELLERALVHQEFDALARGQLAALVLRLDAGLAAAVAGARAPLFELLQNVFHVRLYPPGVTWRNASMHQYRVRCQKARQRRSRLPLFRSCVDPLPSPRRRASPERAGRGNLEP